MGQHAYAQAGFGERDLELIELDTEAVEKAGFGVGDSLLKGHDRQVPRRRCLLYERLVGNAATLASHARTARSSLRLSPASALPSTARARSVARFSRARPRCVRRSSTVR